MNDLYSSWSIFNTVLLLTVRRRKQFHFTATLSVSGRLNVNKMTRAAEEAQDNVHNSNAWT